MKTEQGLQSSDPPGRSVEHQDPKQNTKLRILDAAERLFAREGFQTASLRDITSDAAVNLAAVNYHFGSKMALIEAVIERRLQPLNKLRLERLEEVRSEARSAGRPPRVEEAVRAVVEPTLWFRDSGPGARDFVILVGRALAEPEDDVRTIFLRRLRPLFAAFSETLEEALPGVPREVLSWRIQFAFGALSHTMCTMNRLASLPEGMAPPETDTDSVINMLVTFISEGIKAP